MNDVTTSTAAVASKKTDLEKLIDAKAYVAKLEARIAAAKLLNNVNVNDTVQFTFGRAEKARTLTGTVIGTKETPTGLQLAVSVGEGFDATVYKPYARDITANLTAAANDDAEAPASDEASEDPLAAA